MITFKLNNGAHVLAREFKGRIEPYAYMTETQARKRADAIGGYVIRPTRAYYVVPSAPCCGCCTV